MYDTDVHINILKQIAELAIKKLIRIYTLACCICLKKGHLMNPKNNKKKERKKERKKEKKKEREINNLSGRALLPSRPSLQSDNNG